MAGVKISVLPPGGEIQSNDLIPVARGFATYSVRGDVVFPVTEPKMGNNSVSNRTLSANVVSLDKIRTIPGNRILGNSSSSQNNVVAVQVQTGMIANSAVTTEKIGSGEIENFNIKINTIDLNKLQQISANRVLGAATAGNVIQTQVVGGMIANDAITSEKILEGEVKNVNIGSGAVDRNKIASNEVMFTNLQQIGNITNSVIGYTTANTNAQAIKVSPLFLSLGAPSWDTSGNLNLKGIITQTGKIRPTGWGGGITTFDVYSDGGTIGTGNAGSLNAYINNAGTGVLGSDLTVNNNTNPLKFTSSWSNFTGGAIDRAEISNDTGTYKTLMIVGNRSNNANIRRVSVWDRLEVNGDLTVQGNLTVRDAMYYKNRIMSFPYIWANWNGQNMDVRGSVNVSSVTRIGTGVYRMNFSFALAGDNYCAQWTPGITGTGGGGPTHAQQNQSASWLEVWVSAAITASYNPVWCSASVTYI